jgi:transposase
MMIIGCDFHPRFQQIAFIDQETGEYGERRLSHPEESEQFYHSLAGRQVRVGMEATGSYRWFQRLLVSQGYELCLGDATQIRASSPRRQKTDRRAAEQILRLLAVVLDGWNKYRCQELVAMHDQMNARIAPLDRWTRPCARRLMTHPGVGPVTALSFTLAIGDWRRFPRGKQVASYLGLIPSEASSGQSRRLGSVSKQGNSLVRWLLVEAATTAQRYDPSWHRQYMRLSLAKHHGVAKLAIAHKLAVRLYWMLRSAENYEQIVARNSAGQPARAVRQSGSLAGQSE